MTEAETIKALEERIAALEKGSTFQATQSELQRVEAECLQKLRDIKAALAAEDSTGSGTNAAAAKQLEALRAENEALKQKNAKLQYRVKHVVTEVERLYEEKKMLKAAS